MTQINTREYRHRIYANTGLTALEKGNKKECIKWLNLILKDEGKSQYVEDDPNVHQMLNDFFNI